MKVQLIVLSVVLCAAAAHAARLSRQTYSSRYDSIDVDQILNSERLLNNYFNCLMERGPCTPEGTELRSILPDALESACSKCTDKQKTATEKVFQHLSKHKPAQWTELQAKYDPRGEYRRKYESQARQHGVTV